ncbi:hypothetical protein DYB32_000467 [Aphanomyces invadans]|uniref:Glutamine amidotransferase type-2 domain-containing protein n=1 Tax=Aphanomyces invadans TaxID=157072 RepID=A0A3R7D7F9_9STRA|nr:hypothetical protein DYB32_000467 [Aphanomyces invadans]
MVVSNSCADNNPPVQKVTSNDVEAVIEVSSSDSSSDSSSGKPAHKRRVSVWHTTPVGQTNAAKASSDDDSSSSSDDEAPARQPILSRRPTFSNAGGNTLASPHRGPLWPSLDKFIAMLVSPSRPRLLPDHFVFPKTYSSVAHYMSGLQQAIVEESLCAFDSKSNKQSRLTTASIVAVSPYNALLQSVLFRLPKPNKSKSKSPSVSTPTLLQSHDVLLLRPKSSRMSSESYKSNAGIPGIAMSTSLTQEDIVVLVSTAHSIDTLLSYDIYLIGNLTTGSREYQAALSLPSWPASLQSILTSAVIPTSTSLGMVPPSLIPSLRKHFNDHQFKAIQMAIHQPMTLIQGPPGTGKTHTILGIIQYVSMIFLVSSGEVECYAILRRALLLQPSSRRAKISVGAALGVNTQPDIRLLVTAPSNAAVNVILHKIQAQYPDLAMVRLGQPTSSSLVWLENLIEFDKSKKLVGNDWSSQEARERLLDGAQVVFCTLSGAGSWSMWNPKRSHFDAVIVDEAAQRLSRMDYDHSLFQRLVNNRANDVIMLREQYRMHPDIASLPSRMFYSNDLVNVHHHPPDTVYHTAGFPPYMFYDVMDGAQSRVETSYRNVPEVSFIATRLKALLKIPYDFKNKIGIISPYKSQIEAIKEALDEAKLSKAKIEVNTVDGFQGREKEIIIVSCVRTLRGGDNSFWGDVRRMNVSLTRAISSCWVVGNSNLLQESPAWAELLDDCKRRGVYHKVAAQTPISDMCRMTVYKGLGLDQSILLADLIVKPKHSIIHQSYDCHERFHNTGLPPQLNADGFGIGWYAEKLYSAKARDELLYSPKRRVSRSFDGVVVPRNKEYETPCVFTSISPAWNNRNLVQLADKVSSPLFFAHVRAASIGSLTSETNCHPFTFDKYLFMHNGLAFLPRDLVTSRRSFALFLTHLEELGSLDQEFSGKDMRHAMGKTIRTLNMLCQYDRSVHSMDSCGRRSAAGITEPSLLNFAVTDGDTLIATRYVNVSSSAAASLYFSSGSRWIQSVERPKEYIMQRHNKEEKVFVMASERLSNEPSDWLENSIVTVTKEMNIQICPILTLLGDEPEPEVVPQSPAVLEK